MEKWYVTFYDGTTLRHGRTESSNPQQETEELAKKMGWEIIDVVKTYNEVEELVHVEGNIPLEFYRENRSAFDETSEDFAIQHLQDQTNRMLELQDDGRWEEAEQERKLLFVTHYILQEFEYGLR